MQIYPSGPSDTQLMVVSLDDELNISPVKENVFHKVVPRINRQVFYMIFKH